MSWYLFPENRKDKFINNMVSPDYYNDTLSPRLLYYIYLLKLSIYLIYDTMHVINIF